MNHFPFGFTMRLSPPHFLTGLFFLLKALILSAVLNSAASAQVALVIGNAKYAHAGALRNPINDAQAISQTIRARGFSVDQVTDANAMQMKQAIERFFSHLTQTKKGLFYFAGHGLQIDGKNYLVPVDFRNTDRHGIESTTLSLQWILNRAAQIAPDALVIVLDACRDDPFVNPQSSSARLKGLGEAGQVIPPGVTVVYGASAGQTALDDLGVADSSRNGVFTRFFAQNLSKEELSLQQVMRLTRDQVMQAAATVDTGEGKSHQQIPSFYDASKREQPLFAPLRKDAPRSLPSSVALHIVIPAAVGGPSDVSVRLIAAAIQSRGIRVTLENVIDIAGNQVAGMAYPHDSNRVSLLVSPFHSSLNRHLAADQRLKPISLLSETSMMLAASKNSGVTNMQSLMRLLERRVVKIGTSSSIAPSAVCAQILQKQFGAQKFIIQEFRGAAPAIAELIGGGIDLFCDARPSFQPHVDAGRIAYVANLQEEAASDLNPATAQSQGYAVVAPNWVGVFAASDLPDSRLAELVALFQAVLSDPTPAQRFAQMAMRLVPTEKAGPLEIMMSLRLNAAISR